MSRKVSGIKTNIDLSPYNTLGVSAIASRFIDIKSEKLLSDLFKAGFFNDHRAFVLGGGSNILFLDHPSQPILKVSIKGKRIVEKEQGLVKVQIGAGENWHEFVTWAIKNDFGGVENLALIPGTVGAAPIQNIGAYGVELEKVFDSLELFDTIDGTFKTFKKEGCRFGYRDSIFKQELKGNVVVTAVTLNLTTENHQIEDSYNSLKSYLKEKGVERPTIKDIYEAVIHIRSSKLPDPTLIGNAGSFFKNPVIDTHQFESLQKQYNEMPFYKLNDDEIKIPAAWLIEKTGWKGKRIGDVGTYQNQALVIVNHGNATGAEIFGFSKRIQESVMKEFGIELVPEVNIIE